MTQAATRKWTTKRILGLIATVLAVIMAVTAIYLFVCVYTAKIKNRPISVFGYSYYVVVTPSMVPTIGVGEFVAVKLTDISHAKTEDIIVFYNRGNYDDLDSEATIIHRVRAVNPDGTLTTRGDANPTDQTETVTAESFVGILAHQSVFMGWLVGFASNPLNWVFGILLLIAVYLIYRFAKNLVKQVRTVKTEQAIEKEAEEIQTLRGREEEKARMAELAKQFGIDPPKKDGEDDSEPHEGTPDDGRNFRG